MILRTVKYGKKRAIVLSDEILESAGLNISSPIQIMVNPSGGLFLQAVEESEDNSTLGAFKKIKRKYNRLFSRLADR